MNYKSPHLEPEAPLQPTLGLLPLLAVTVAIAAPASAQETNAPYAITPGSVVLDTITVGAAGEEAANNYRVTESSSSKFTAPLLDTPKSVTVITEREMRERNATSVVEVLRTTPGVTLGSGEGGTPMGDRPFIRGYQAATDMMIDGMRNLGRTTMEVFATESVELVKGPGGAYAGRGSTGGSINLVSKQAREGVTFHDVSALAGNANQLRFTYDGNIDLGEGMAARLNLMYQDSDVPGRDFLRDDRKGIALALSKRFGASKVSVNLYHSKTKSTPDFGVPMATADYRPGLSGGASFGSGTKGDPYLPIELGSKSAFYGSARRDYRDVENQSATLRFEHEFDNGFTLDSALTWIGSRQEYIVTRPSVVPEFNVRRGGGAATPNPDWDPTQNLLNRDLRTGKKRNTATAFQTALTGDFQTGTVKHDFAVGMEITREKLRSASATGTSTLPVTGLANPDPWDPVTGMPVFGAYANPVKVDNNALYVFDTMTFSDQWLMNFGLRYDNYKVSQGDLSRKDNMFNYSVGIIYKPAPNGSIYLAYGTSSNPSGECAGMAGGADGASACTLTGNNDDLKPERSKSIELGTKWEVLDDQLMLTAAIFQTEKKNARATDELGNVALLGHNRARGFELGAAGQITDRWGVSAGYAFIDAKVLNDGYSNGAPSENNGNRLQFVARNAFSVWSTYDVTPRWTVGGGATYTSMRYLNAANTSALPEQWQVDAMVSYDVSDSATLQVNVNNLFDKRLYDASHVGIFANRAPGRSVTARLDYSF